MTMRSGARVTKPKALFQSRVRGGAENGATSVGFGISDVVLVSTDFVPVFMRICEKRNFISWLLRCICENIFWTQRPISLDKCALLEEFPIFERN